MNWTDIIGYTASIALMVSFAFRNQRRLRIVNSFGCVFFIAYGFLRGNDWPIIIPNIFILGLNLYYLLVSTSKASEVES